MAELGSGVLVHALLALLGLALLALWNHTLRRQVRRQTESLRLSLSALEHTCRAGEAALKEQEAMLNNGMVGILKVVDRIIIWTNPAVEVMLGYEPHEMVGTPTLRYYADAAAYRQVGDQAFAQIEAHGIYRTQVALRHRAGHSVWVDMSGSRLSEHDHAFLWTLMDISASRQTQQALQEALQRLQKLADRVPGMVYQYRQTPDGAASFSFVSEAVADLFGVTPQQALQDAQRVIAQVHPEDQVALHRSIAVSARGLTPWQHEFRRSLGDGRVRWLYGNAMPERQPGGDVLWHGFMTDITERRASDERLRQLSLSVEQAPVSIVITDLQGCIQYANPCFTRNTGYTLAEAVGQNPRILKSGQTPSERYEDLWRTITAGGVWQGELHNRRKTGELFIEHAVISPVRDADGQWSHFVAVKEDITLRKMADQALQSSLREKVALLHEVHHRVKNNLQVITSLLRLEASRSTDPRTQDVLRDMKGRIYAMALLHESLYRTGTFASVDLAAYLRQLATQAFRVQTGPSRPVRLALDLQPVQVVMDQATPCGLLVNELLSNCLKHAFLTDQGGCVHLHSGPVEGASRWCVSVSDDGVGLGPDFEQRRQSALGLQLVADLALQLQGVLRIEPGAIAGVCLAVEFPLQVFPAADSGMAPMVTGAAPA